MQTVNDLCAVLEANGKGDKNRGVNAVFGPPAAMRVLVGEQSVVSVPDEQRVKTKLPPGVDIVALFLNKGEVTLVTNGDIGELGNAIVLSVTPKDAARDAKRFTFAWRRAGVRTLFAYSSQSADGVVQELDVSGLTCPDVVFNGDGSVFAMEINRDDEFVPAF